MDCKYFLLVSKDTEQFETPVLDLYEFDGYSELWHYLNDLLFMNEVRWYQIFYGDTLMLQKLVK